MRECWSNSKSCACTAWPAPGPTWSSKAARHAGELALAARAPAAGRDHGPGHALGEPPDAHGQVPGAPRPGGLRLRGLAGGSQAHDSWPAWRSPSRRTTWCWWAGPARARRIWPRPSAWRASPSMASGCGSTRRWIWSTRWSRRRPGQGRAHRSEPAAHGPGHPGRAGLPALQPGRRGLAVPPAEQAVRAHQRDDHDQPGLQGVVQRVRRRQDDHGAAGPAHAPLPHRGDGQRVHRFMHSTAVAKKRIKAREQARKSWPSATPACSPPSWKTATTTARSTSSGCPRPPAGRRCAPRPSRPTSASASTRRCPDRGREPQAQGHPRQALRPRPVARRQAGRAGGPGVHHRLWRTTAGEARDVLGQVYEYFLGMFASAEGKRGGQFYTPRSIVKTLVAVLAPHHGKVYDPCCGSGGMFVQSEEFIEATAASWATWPSSGRRPTPPPGGWRR
jgi:hypothetical protein